MKGISFAVFHYMQPKNPSGWRAPKVNLTNDCCLKGYIMFSIVILTRNRPCCQISAVSLMLRILRGQKDSTFPCNRGELWHVKNLFLLGGKSNTKRCACTFFFYQETHSLGNTICSLRCTAQPQHVPDQATTFEASLQAQKLGRDGRLACLWPTPSPFIHTMKKRLWTSYITTQIYSHSMGQFSLWVLYNYWRAQCGHSWGGSPSPPTHYTAMASCDMWK